MHRCRVVPLTHFVLLLCINLYLNVFSQQNLNTSANRVKIVGEYFIVDISYFKKIKNNKETCKGREILDKD